MLFLIGLGLGDEKDISSNALEAIKSCDKIYLENYTSIMGCSFQDLEKLYQKKVILADRNLVEKQAEDTILKDAEKVNTAFLVVGDIFGATTHTDLIIRAKKKGIKIKYFHNASIINAVGVTGLELYKFGKTTSMVFFDPKWKPITAYDVVVMNKKNGLHTLILLDIKVAEPTKEDIMKEKTNPQPQRFMTVKECLQQLLELEKEQKKGIIKEDTLAVGCARIGHKDQLIKYAKISELMEFDFGKPPHSVIIPGKLHFMEEEFLSML